MAGMSDAPPPDALVEAVADAINDADEQNHSVQSFDYTAHGAAEPLVIRDLSLPGGAQALWQGTDREQCEARYAEIKRTRLARAALSICRAHFAGLARAHGAAIRTRISVTDDDATAARIEREAKRLDDFADDIDGRKA